MNDLDPIIHAPARLRIMTTLAPLGTESSLTFPALQRRLDMTAGNLSTHLRKLEDAGYIEQNKVIEGRNPATYVSITSHGRAAFDGYMKALRELLKGINP